MLTYKNYIARIEIDTKAGVFHGRVLGIKDVITFEGRTPEEVSQEFRKSIDGYLRFCESLGQIPDQPNALEELPGNIGDFLDQPGFISQLLIAVKPYLRNDDPDMVFQFITKLENFLIAQESMRVYLDNDPDAIVRITERINYVLAEYSHHLQRNKANS